MDPLPPTCTKGAGPLLSPRLGKSVDSKRVLGCLYERPPLLQSGVSFFTTRATDIARVTPSRMKWTPLSTAAVSFSTFCHLLRSGLLLHRTGTDWQTTCSSRGPSERAVEREGCRRTAGLAWLPRGVCAALRGIPNGGAGETRCLYGAQRR